MTCREHTAELVECARRGSGAGVELAQHLTGCPACAERWQTERGLAEEFRSMRLMAIGAASATRAARQRAVMAEFDFRQAAFRKPAVSKWAWTLAAAAALVCAVFIGHEFGVHARPRSSPATPVRTLPHRQNIIYEASMDASELSGDDFVAVPYTPPLAQGEMVRVVRADLYPEALTSMGIDVDPAADQSIPAEVVVGEDGLPRAVRITSDSQSGESQY